MSCTLLQTSKYYTVGYFGKYFDVTSRPPIVFSSVTCRCPISSFLSESACSYCLRGHLHSETQARESAVGLITKLGFSTDFFNEFSIYIVCGIQHLARAQAGREPLTGIYEPGEHFPRHVDSRIRESLLVREEPYTSGNSCTRRPGPRVLTRIGYANSRRPVYSGASVKIG